MTGDGSGRGPVGIVGVGALGLAVTERLVAAHWIVNGFRRGSLQAFRELGGLPSASASAVAASSDILVLLLPSDAALADVMAEIAPALRPAQIVLCLGTHRIVAKQAAFDLARSVGAILVDGEVSGTPAMLRAGQASVMVAGDPDAIATLRPMLDAVAKTTSDLGPFGHATKMKLVTNYLVGVHTMAAAEALHLATQLGLDPLQVVRTIEGSAGGSVMLSVRGRLMAAGTLDGGPMTGFLRFFDLLREASPGLEDGDAPVLELAERLYRRAIEDGFGDKDIAAISTSLAIRRRPEPRDASSA